MGKREGPGGGSGGCRAPWAAAQLVGTPPGQVVGWEGHGADRVARPGLGSPAGAVGGQREGRPWPRSGSAGVWTQSWRGRFRKQARAGGLETVKESRARRCCQTPGLVYRRDGARGLVARRPGQRWDPVAEVSEEVTEAAWKRRGRDHSSNPNPNQTMAGGSMETNPGPGC